MGANKIIYKRGIHVGEASAEDDGKLLFACFIELPIFEQLKDMNSSKSVLLGRTGSGKSALLQNISQGKKNSIIVDPKEVAIDYFANTTIINFLLDNDFDLNILFEVMWKHILLIKSVELYFENQSSFEKALDRVLKSGNPARVYFEKYRESFWQDSEVILKELSTQFDDKISAELSATLGVPSSNVKSVIQSTTDLSKSQRVEIASKVKQAIPKSQLRELAQAIDGLNLLMDNEQKNYYVLIDDLDLDWAENNLRYQLIYSLISVIKPFRKIRNVKVICALRKDLYEKVMHLKEGKQYSLRNLKALLRRYIGHVIS